MSIVGSGLAGELAKMRGTVSAARTGIKAMAAASGPILTFAGHPGGTLRMLEAKDYPQIIDASGALDLTFASGRGGE